ncbi:hypothetical protein GCM10010326_50930 [Streptomyces xanthochromogenes]|uniref:Uncharacterized protein n=1 Tax=Streptomyces xanthochromogenes TaxID=67384 RepID=A0ABQ3AG43_9ACTN|nr:hypothetical protein GCM10010326_50930 [Streptomyces xanthochromogenes]
MEFAERRSAGVKEIGVIARKGALAGPSLTDSLAVHRTCPQKCTTPETYPQAVWSVCGLRKRSFRKPRAGPRIPLPNPFHTLIRVGIARSKELINVIEVTEDVLAACGLMCRH